MTVAELMRALESEDPEANVRFAYNYGDRANTIVAASVLYVEEVDVRHSDYVNNMRVVEDEEDEKAGDKRAVVLFSSYR